MSTQPFTNTHVNTTANFKNNNTNPLPKRQRILEHPVTKFLYQIEKNGEEEKKIKLDSKYQVEKYSNGKPVILGDKGYPVNNKGQILEYNRKTGDLSKNEKGNPYIYNPHVGRFFIPKNQIKYPFPPDISYNQNKNQTQSFIYAQGPGQNKKIPGTVINPYFKNQKLPPGGFKNPPQLQSKTQPNTQPHLENNQNPLLLNKSLTKKTSLLNKLRKLF
jgi:hypothetical protein